MRPWRAILLLVLWLGAVGVAIPAVAQDPYLEADAAVAEILFDYDFGAAFASYTVSENGFVTITFASNMPDELYSEILDRLKRDAAIEGVLAGKSGPSCSIW